MNDKDGIQIRGHCSWEVRDAQGNLVENGEKNNLIMTLGLDEIVNCAGYGLSGTPFRALALGSSDATNTNPAQTTLDTEITTHNCGRGAATVTKEASSTLQLVKTWTANGSETIKEIGIFNNSTSGGVMLGRLVIGPITVDTGFSITFTYKVAFS